MSSDEDYLYALQLQNELNAEEEALAEASTFYFIYFALNFVVHAENTCER